MRVLFAVALLAACASPVDLDDEPVVGLNDMPRPADVRPDPLPRTEPLDLSVEPGHADGIDDAFEPVVLVQRHPSHPLLAVVTADCVPDCTLRATVRGPGLSDRVLTRDQAGPDHRLIVAGLRELSSYDIDVSVLSVNGDTARGLATVETGPLGFTPPPATVRHAGNPGGVLLTACYRYVGPQPNAIFFAMDREGHVVWFHRFPIDASMPPQIRQRDDGTFFLFADQKAWVIDIEGNLLRHWKASNGHDTWHHDVAELPEGGLLALGEEYVDVHETEPPYTVLADTVLEYDEDSRVVERWRAVDTLDVTRFPGRLAWTDMGGETYDWTHGNAVTLNPDGQGYLVSMRHQSHIASVDRTTTEVEWLLGEDGDFELLEGRWFNAQHHPTWLSDTELLVYDNRTEYHVFGSGRADSRVVIYELDESAMTARETWSWELPVYTPFMGGAQGLDGGEVLVTAGGRGDGKASFYLVDEAGDMRWSIDVQGAFFRGEIVQAL